MGFGFVNFEKNEDAAIALESLNGTKLREGKCMKVSVARPAWKANIHSNLYLAGFPSTLDTNEIMDLFRMHATNVENVRLLLDVDKKPRGAAVIRMSSEEAAVNVISSLNGVPVRNGTFTSTLHVKPWRPEFRAERVSDETLSASASKENRRPRKDNTTWPTFDAQQLLQQMTYNYHQRISSLPPIMATPETFDTHEEDHLATLFVFHLPPDVPESFLGHLFSQFGGEIESVQIMRNKGYGFISFYRAMDAAVAMAHLDGYLFPGSKKPIRIELKQ